MPDIQETPVVEKKEDVPEKDLFVWSAPSRSFTQKGREFWVKVVAVASIFGFIIFIVEGAMPVLLMIALIFLFYVLSTVRPENIEYRISNLGIKIGESRTDWNAVTRFWFLKRASDEILVFELTALPGRLEYVYNAGDQQKIREILKKYIPEEETPETRLDKASEWLSSKLS
jgi:hypothetical protein